MKKVNYTIVAVALVAGFSCKKDSFIAPPVASLTVTNAIVNGPSIRVNSIVYAVPNNNFRQLTLTPDQQNLYVWPVGDSLKPVYTHDKFTVADRQTYSLFVAGQVPDISGVLIRENLPYHNDSTFGVRFINLSPNSEALNITLTTSPTLPEVSNLAYLQYTDFKLYTAKAANTSYIWQVRKATDNSLLFSYTLSTPRFTNVTLVIRGLMQSSPAMAMTRVNNER